jgi:aryl-alcohol dehydrogenase-like predicted oxidoreductase
MSSISRRNFLKVGVAAGALAGVGELSLHAERQTATDWVTLGKSNMKVTRLAMGTGTNNGNVQAALGQEGFTKLVHYAYDRGIRFFETAQAYHTPAMLGAALKGLPRESYRIMSKVQTVDGVDPAKSLDEMRRTMDTDYFDIMLLHWQHTADWPEQSKPWQDAILEAQAKQAIRVHGASVHGLPALRRVPDNQWLDIAMIRMNHRGRRMDSEDFMHDDQGNVDQVVEHVKMAHSSGLGVISMKLVGEGVFDHEDRQKAMRFAFRNAGVDAVTVGVKSPQEIDEAIDNLNLALA